MKTKNELIKDKKDIVSQLEAVKKIDRKYLSKDKNTIIKELSSLLQNINDDISSFSYIENFRKGNFKVSSSNVHIIFKNEILLNLVTEHITQELLRNNKIFNTEIVPVTKKIITNFLTS